MYSNPNNLSVNDVYNNIMNPPKQDLCPVYKSYNGPNYHMTNSNYYNQNSIQQPSYDPQQMNQYNQQIQQPPIEPQYNNDNYNNNYSNNDNNYINENDNYNNINNNNYDNINNNNNYNNIQENYNNPPPTNDYQNSIAKINQINNNPPKKTQNAYEFLTKVVNSKVGLSNISNISYMTSCLQTLIHCPLFISKFLEEGIPIFKSKSRDTPVAGCLYNLMVDITKSNDFTSISPNIIKNCIQDIHNEFQDNNNEHDCQEFCRYFIQDINTDLNRVTEENKPKNNNENYEGEPNKRFEYELFIKENLSKENSIITDLFFGYLSFEFTCMNCGGKEFSFSQFLDLPLQFESNKNIHLNTLLRKNILKKEIVEMEDKCSLCHKSNEKEQIIKIAKLPNVLMLSLQRNDYENNIKNESVVQFDEIMDLSELIDNDLIYEEDNNYRYKLFGVIYFVNGKYISFSFVEDAWFKFNNEEVVKENPVLNSNNVYSLFYMKI
jgi:ubiquitin C-terminal hydrolase